MESPPAPTPAPTPASTSRPSPEDLRGNLADVRSEIADAALRVGRDPAEVRLVAVTKSVDAETVCALIRVGQTDLAENRTPLLAEHRGAAEAEGLRPRWHLIGHWQKNKVRRGLPSVDVFHALDSLDLARLIGAEVLRAGRPPMPCLVEVNVSGEASKGGFSPEGYRAAAARLAEVEGIELQGMMTMAPMISAPRTPDPGSPAAGPARACFASLRELRDWARTSGYLAGSELSMGMSDDFVPAVMEGSTMVRIGRRLFLPRPLPRTL